MEKKKDWGLINGGIATAFVMGSIFCSFFPALYGTAVIFLVLAVIAIWFMALQGI